MWGRQVRQAWLLLFFSPGGLDLWLDSRGPVIVEVNTPKVLQIPHRSLMGVYPKWPWLVLYLKLRPFKKLIIALRTVIK
jgi:hypothetical protein